METKNLLTAIIILLVAFLGFQVFRSDNKTTEALPQSKLEIVKENKVIRVGYAAYAPYVDKNLQTGELSGYAVDVMKEIADQMGVKIEWIETTWQTYIADLKTDKFDILAGPLFLTIPRVMEVDFSEPIGYFSGVAALVKNGDNRFATIEDLNKEGLTISVPQGWVAHEYARKYLNKATVKPFKEEGTALVITDMINGNADVALVDGPTAQQYLEQNPNQNVKALFLENPPIVAPGGFAFKKGDTEWANFINSSIEVLRTGGTLKKIASKYHLYSFDVDLKYIPQ